MKRFGDSMLRNSSVPIYSGLRRKNSTHLPAGPYSSSNSFKRSGVASNSHTMRYMRSHRKSREATAFAGQNRASVACRISELEKTGRPFHDRPHTVRYETQSGRVVDPAVFVVLRAADLRIHRQAYGFGVGSRQIVARGLATAVGPGLGVDLTPGERQIF